MSIFKKIWSAIKKLFGNKKLKTAVYVGIDVVELLKNFIDSPFAPIVTALIPGGLDDVIVDQLKRLLPIVMVDLVAAGRVLELGSADAIIQWAVTKLKTLPEEKRNELYRAIAAKISQALSKDSDGGTAITFAEAKEIVQYIYDNEYKAKP